MARWSGRRALRRVLAAAAARPCPWSFSRRGRPGRSGWRGDRVAPATAGRPAPAPRPCRPGAAALAGAGTAGASRAGRPRSAPCRAAAGPRPLPGCRGRHGRRTRARTGAGTDGPVAPGSLGRPRAAPGRPPAIPRRSGCIARPSSGVRRARLASLRQGGVAGRGGGVGQRRRGPGRGGRAGHRGWSFRASAKRPAARTADGFGASVVRNGRGAGRPVRRSGRARQLALQVAVEHPAVRAVARRARHVGQGCVLLAV